MDAVPAKETSGMYRTTKESRLHPSGMDLTISSGK